ncbi:Uncharacterised protein [Chlamydia abortus]|nr:Uncharacterised protein [Chlamydia abortus]
MTIFLPTPYHSSPKLRSLLSKTPLFSQKYDCFFPSGPHFSSIDETFSTQISLSSRKEGIFPTTKPLFTPKSDFSPQNTTVLPKRRHSLPPHTTALPKLRRLQPQIPLLYTTHHLCSTKIPPFSRQ